MKKRFFKVSNMLMGAIITIMGFGGCKSLAKSANNQTGNASGNHNEVEDINEVYGPPLGYDVPEIPGGDSVAEPVATKLERENMRVVYGPPPMTGRRSFEAPLRAEIDTTKVYDVLEQMPRFPDGDAAMTAWIKQHLKYPEEARRENIEGRVILTFVVEPDGSTTGFMVVRSVHPTLDAEAVRLLRTMPRWEPGRQNDVAVRVKYTIPITFKLNNQ